MANLKIFLILVLTTAGHSASKRNIVLSSLGENITITCHCPRARVYNKPSAFISWVKIAANGATFIDTVCEKNCRISHQSVGESKIELTVRQITKDDKGRYYCALKTSRTPAFQGKGTFLHIADSRHSINRSEVNLLTEFSGSAHMLEYSRSVVLYCLVTGLVSPNINITWHSTEGQQKAGQTWVSDDTEGFTAGSRLGVNVTTGKDSQNAEGHREEWWCEMHQGNFTVKSNMSSLHTTSESDWCPVLLYSAVALILLCALSLVLLTLHWVLYLRTGGEASVTSNIQPSQDDTNSGVGVRLNQPLTSRRQPNNQDVEVYSVVNFVTVNAITSPSHQSNTSDSVTYTSLDFQRPRRPERRNREKKRDPENDTYSAVCVH